MASRATVMRAMAVAKYDLAASKKSLIEVRDALKSYALVEVTKLTRKNPSCEVLLTVMATDCFLYIQGVYVDGKELTKRFTIAQKQLGPKTLPQGLFFGLDGRVSYTRFD